MKDTRIETITAPLTLEQLQALGEGITPGIWSRSKDGRPELRNQNNLIESSGGVLVAYGQLSDADAILCAAAPDVRNSALSFIDERDRAKEEVVALRKLIGDAMTLWRDLGDPMLWAAAKELQEGLDALATAPRAKAAVQ